jgi:hypothetical protein
VPVIRGGKTEIEILAEEVIKLANSSKRLEHLTYVLIALTAILAIMTGITIYFQVSGLR